MPFEVRIATRNYRFENHAKESLLESALNAGIPVSYGCSNGNCGDCRARLVSGGIQAIRHSDHVFSAAERDSGAFLMCTHRADSDLVIEADIATDSSVIPHQQIEVRVRKTNRINDRIATLDVQTPRTRRLRFLAGQWAHLETPDGTHFELPIASCPCDDRNLQFHVPLDTASRLMECRKGQTLALSGPLGEFVLVHPSSRNRLMLGSGLGFPPLKSIIEHSLSLQPETDIDLVWLEPPGQPHYMENHLRMWDDVLDNFTLHRIQCVAMAGEQPGEEFLRTIEKLARADLDIYVAGPGQLLDLVNAELARLGIPDTWVKTCIA